MMLSGGASAPAGGNAVIVCDLCGQPKECVQREIERKEYDICSACWTALAERLKGKGRVRRGETVFLPPMTNEPEPEQVKAVPGEPPKIWGRQ